MKILDSQGRLFGKISILDLGAVLIIFMVLVGIFVFPGTNKNSVAQVGNVITKPVEVDAIALGLKGRYPEKLLKEGEKTQLIIRNQPYGEVDLKSVEFLTRKVAVPQPDGTVRALPDPRDKELFSRNVLLTLKGQGRVTNDGPVLGNIKVKIGMTIELEGRDYNFNASVIDVRVQE
ncbi:MAG: DUF4330 domain-containing protein [Trichodesmium sp. St2_bin6]|uniref:Pyruvate/2-oxoglutarate dehydrogenase complex,dihydrolipoamide dehydrogenase (E3) component n=1 Tax=Trichodesmium erythraeum (strain IMS101) TaxID=203124 RepID=Q112U4_TRIEI|nr:DUF4330 domain-containing protein [Trichodesmium erythraeum GBRTRLIN201]MDE5072236.1 DUF4330 domain-containing protein [Trichodesmium sp. St5_bin8]MDE5077937.1 DUF4330 domain-containing protein [Trichodesmium sp. St2_bin6]MDE5096079.1 DUF4330 domain-containing protein [Trichodesmium sp. St11_bin5]